MYTITNVVLMLVYTDHTKVDDYTQHGTNYLGTYCWFY